MSSLVKNFNIDWKDSVLWAKARYNTLWCLIGCSIGDFGTIAFFQFTGIGWPVLSIMIGKILFYGHNKWINYIYIARNSYSDARTKLCQSTEYCNRNVINLNDINGSRNEFG